MTRHRKKDPGVPAWKRRWWFQAALLAVAIVGPLAALVAYRDRLPTWTGRSSQKVSPTDLRHDETRLLPRVNLEATPHEMAAEAQHVLDELLAAHPESPAAYGIAGHIYSLFGRSVEAIASWQRSVSLDPDFAQGYRYLGIQRMEDGDYAEAVSLLQRAYDLDPRFPGIANQLADALMHNGQLAAARDVLQESIRMGTSTLGVHFLLGKIALQEKAFDVAYERLLAAVKEDPDDTNVYYSLMRAAARAGRKSEVAKWRSEFQTRKAAQSAEGVDAMRSREDARRVRGYLATTYREAGNVYHQLGERQAAESHWLHAAAWQPGDVVIRHQLVHFYTEHGAHGRRVKILQQLREIEPDNAAHVLELARSLVETGDRSAAEAEFLRYCKLAPERGEGHSGLALLYLDDPEQLRSAVLHAKQAVTRQPTAANYFLLGVAQQASGEMSAALAAVGRALELEPQNAGYRNAYEALRSGP